MLTRRDAMVLGLSAAAAFALTLSVGAGGGVGIPLNAGDDKPVQVAVKTPTFQAGDCTVTARLKDAAAVDPDHPGVIHVKPGGAPTFQLVVANPSSHPADAAFSAELQSMSMRDSFSRVPMVRKPAWKEEYALHLQAGETRTLEVALKDHTLGQGDLLSLVVSGKEPLLRTQLLAVQATTPAPHGDKVAMK